MQEKKIKFTDVLFVGLAFFASYFGAGNLIFPPMLGLQSGSNWLSGMIGMLASGVGLPILAIIVLGMCGSVQKISDHVNKKFYTVMIGAIMILCCCVSIPRTAAVGIEMGLQGIWSGAPYLVFVILYFVIAFLFAKDRGTALDKVGKILTPIMTIILFILVVKGAVSPIGTPGAASVDNAFVNSFLGGYSTGDVLVSFLAAGVFFDSIKRKGYEGEAFRKAHVRACLIAAVCLAVVYGGLLYMGACVSTEYTPDSISNANLLLAIIRSSGGQIAIYGLCLSVVLACLTTAISQITAVADFYETATHGKLSYKVLVMIVPIVTTIVASFGLDTGDAPITQSGISPLVSLVSRDAQLSQVGHLCFGLLPLLPDVHSEPAPHPFIPGHQRSFHIGCSKVANPAADELLHFLHYPADIASTVALCKKLQLFLRLGKRLSVHTDIGTATSPAQTESKKLEFLLCEDTGHLALFRVHFQLQPAFQILPAGFQQTLCCTLAFGKHHDVICISNQLYPSAVHLPIKFIEVDVCQQRR